MHLPIESVSSCTHTPPCSLMCNESLLGVKLQAQRCCVHDTVLLDSLCYESSLVLHHPCPESFIFVTILRYFMLRFPLLVTAFIIAVQVQAHITYTGTATPITAVCDKNIRLDDFLYGLFWNDGSWRGLASNAQLYSTYTRETAEEDHAAHANNTFQHCPNSATTAASHSTNPSSSQTAHSSSTGAAGSGHHVDTGAVIGGVVGGVLGLCLLMLGAACVMRRARGGKAAVYDEQPLDATEATSLGAHPFTLQQTDLTSNLRTPPAYEKHAPQRLEGSASEPPTSSGAGEQVGRTHASTVPYTAMSGRLNESVFREYHHNIINSHIYRFVIPGWKVVEVQGLGCLCYFDQGQDT
ncbi:hypothetical protein POSPLADRAFT_1180213 [Postia placenta MAD-698-R-SB12]|uniref:Uncharacterized protein n=1 Tax=Postia placenta MAD-698-R-SB12 TaxID=670580 RepID=A0A1X6N3W4_9APHY|nr:hypothetical protein POSPLADRAFT_1180213 [Postia placenta MAD-698-R-SB12]OSX63166.1 hypothetical protein POSPLADRAFT_1180213 [Postia placenta MAD-698-R-SB12]